MGGTQDDDDGKMKIGCYILIHTFIRKCCAMPNARGFSPFQ